MADAQHTANVGELAWLRHHPPAPLRTLHGGQHHEELVTFLIHPPGDLVHIARFQWLGD